MFHAVLSDVAVFPYTGRDIVDPARPPSDQAPAEPKGYFAALLK